MTKQTGKNTHFLQALKYAFEGIKYALATERNMRTHLIVASLVICLGVLCQCSVSEWLWLMHCIVLVLVMEMLNSIVEIVIDVLSCKNYFDWAKRAKDMAAGAVLLCSIYAVIVASFIFMPKLFH